MQMLRYSFFYILFFSSFFSLFHVFPLLSLTLTHLSPNKALGSYRPFVPRRNLWSRRDILLLPLTVTQLSNTVHPVLKGVCQLHVFVSVSCTYSAVTGDRRCLFLSMCSKASCVYMSSLSDVKRSSVRKEPDPLTPAAQFPPAGC